MAIGVGERGDGSVVENIPGETVGWHDPSQCRLSRTQLGSLTQQRKVLMAQVLRTQNALPTMKRKRATISLNWQA
jgi:hypothetical protein